MGLATFLFLKERSHHSSHLTSSYLMLTDLISSEPSVVWLVAATGNWVVRCEANQFAVAATNHSALS